ncbi:hypothetical protein GXW77_03365 [Roseomonas alkaliterrae]|uniref:Putative iron-regulated membrane protein n=1 Tax=Neoroseomonas alkaliterrae TaxID=1452450 RepID=A0A840Y957_9PROT|nr:hypothetical protein [Neoroseomonas alkaliterrae]MBB5690394.1 putative iron-regulated membrane protein [Neoroseomonas alkaliterrae]MBR0675208.1 hypothetical protein [Neoroseomonas alkaliterrae]
MSGKNNARPPRHWIKRPPRPSRAGNAPPPRQKPGIWHAALAVCAGLLLGLLGASLAARAGAPEGVPGLAAGIGICLGAVLVWRGFGGTRQDVRDLFT